MLTVHAGELVVGGGFSEAGGLQADGVARWDGTSWSPLAGTMGQGILGYVKALASFAGSLYAGGSFGQAGGVFVNGIARWDGASWKALPDTIANGVVG